MKVPVRLTALATLMAAALGAPPGFALDDGATAGRYVFVPNRGSADIAVIDTRTDLIAARIEVGNVPHQVVVSTPLDKLIVTNTRDNTISIVDLAKLETEATLTLDVEPEHMELSPDGRLLAVGNIGAGTVSLVSLVENREVARIEGLHAPHNLTFGAHGTLLYVANLGANHVSVIDVTSARIVARVPIDGAPALAALDARGNHEFQGLINVTPTADGRFGFAAHGESDLLAVLDLRKRELVKTLRLGDRPWRAFATADGRHMLVPNNGDSTVSVISTATAEVVATLPGAADMTGINSDSSGSTAFVISRGENKLVVLDLVEMRTAGEISLPSVPETGVVTPDGKKLYVALSGSNQVAVIDTRSRKLMTLIDDVGDAPWGATIPGALNYCH